MGYVTHSGGTRTGLSNPQNWYRGGVESQARDRPRLTPKGERTRSRIVEAAARLIHERGVAATTLDDIRSGAGVSGSQLSHYFAGKDELVQAVIDYQAGTITGNQRHADLGSPEGLRAWRDTVIAQVKSGEGKGGCPLGSIAGQVAETDAQARALIAAGFGQWSAAISDGLRRLHDAGHLPKGADPDDLAVTLLAALQGGLLLAQVQRDTGPLETALDTILELARISRRDAPADGQIPRPQIPREPDSSTSRHEGTDSETATSQEEIPSPSGLVKDDHVHPDAAQNDQFGAG
jgi:TetR/AcrR family transcriptional regulator, transcriptional repressor for nem operon